MTKKKQTAAWGGNPPQSPEEASERLTVIAMECFSERGMRKAFMAEVARIAGISRPTLYSYFPTKESLMFSAMDFEVGDWLRRQRRRIQRFDTPQERRVEGVIYAIEKLPKTKVLKFMADPEYVASVAIGDPNFQRSLEASIKALEPTLQLAPELVARQFEIAELVQRTVTSFLQYQIGKPRNKRELREFMHRTLVPAVGLPQL